ILPVSPHRGSGRFVRLLPPATGGDARGDRARRRLRRRRRRIDPNLLCCGAVDSRTRNGAAEPIPEERIMIKGFKEFLLKNNVLALAVAVIVGGAVGKVVTALATDIIMPIISPLLPSGDFRKAQITIGPAELKYGDFLGSVVDFVIIAFIVYLI